mgnify:CR=1 FL=1
MNRIVFTLGIWLFPAACTALGAAGVFLLRRQARPATRRILCGMAAGIMLAASVWSLLLPAIARSQGRAAWVPPALGLILGAVGLLRLEPPDSCWRAAPGIAGVWCWPSPCTTCRRAWW